MDFLKNWKQQIQRRFLTLKWQLQQGAPLAAYATLTGTSLFPLVEAAHAAVSTGQSIPFSLWMALGSITGNIGSNLVAEQIQRWADAKQPATELEVIDWVRISVRQNQQLRQELDVIVEQLEAVDAAVTGVDTARRDQLIALLTQEATQINSTLAPMLSAMQRTATSTQTLVDYATQEREQPAAVAHYLQALIAECDPIDIAAIDEDYATGREASVRLADVFTTLHLLHSGSKLARLDEQTVQEALSAHLANRNRQPHEKYQEPDLQREMRRQDEKEVSPISAVEAVETLQRLVILGVPGGGKSSLVNFLTAELAKKELGQPDKLPNWQKTMPVRIVLRRFAAWLPNDVKKGMANHVWDYLNHQFNSHGCAEAFPVIKRRLRERGGIIFFDGLDEVRESDAENKRTTIKEAIVAFSQPLRHCRVVVTCREYAYKQGDAWQLPATFPQFELALFDVAQMHQFAATWYRTVAPSKGWDGAKAEREAEKLISAIRQMSHLHDLAQYPLLLTLMTQIHGRDGTLPDDRARLYERAVNLLLSHWESRIDRDYDETIQAGLIVQLKLRRDDLRSALARVALQAHEQQERDPERNERAADVRKADLRDTLGKRLGDFNKAETVMKYVQERAGLLQARANETYTFPHRSFQEYLAAVAIWEMSDPAGFLKERVQRDAEWWREVFLLAAGSQSDTPKSVADLVDEIVPQHTPAHLSSAVTSWVLLAEQALRETRFAHHVEQEKLDQFSSGRFARVEQKVRDWLLTAFAAHEQLTLRERFMAGDALGRIGDPRAGVGVKNGVPDIVWGGLVLAGTYTIGQENPEYNEEKERTVTIDHAFRLAKYPVTVAQFAAFMMAEDINHPDWWQGLPEDERQFSSSQWTEPTRPRETISWYQAVAFCRWLSDKLGEVVMLPHEHEWEVTARYAGNGTTDKCLYPWGSDEITSNHANYYKTNLGQTSPVGLFPTGEQPELNLHDLSGNVWEWCANKIDDVDQNEVDQSGDNRTLRGGSWPNDADRCRAAYRNFYHPHFRFNLVGLRLCVRVRPSHL